MAHSKAASQPTCSSQHCSDWARIYLKYCLCSAKDGVAIFLGTISIISWGVAEIPQILTNFHEKSTKGLSVAFLMTWVVGDLFNLIGCILEPATLPTQFYVALLYTATTMILTGQTIYYGHIDHRHKSHKKILSSKTRNFCQENQSLLGDAMKSNVGGYQENAASVSEDSNTKSSPIPVTGQLSPSDSNGRNFYFVSARSLSKSPVPNCGTWLAYSHDDGRSHHLNDGHHDQQFAATEPLLSSQSAPTKFSTKNMLSVVPSAGLLICICVYHLSFRDNTAPHRKVVKVGRKLLQNELRGNETSGAGTLLGWMMAAIYVGGRLPQICLNIRRGNVQGLNPLMFIFALVGNITYVGSILVKSFAWSAIKPNLPWLVDAGGCAILDAFIVIQFVYFRFQQPNKSASNNNLA